MDSETDNVIVNLILEDTYEVCLKAIETEILIYLIAFSFIAIKKITICLCANK